jgi:hypothetical protein
VARLHQRASALTEEEFVVIRLVVRELLVSSPRAPALLARFSRGHIPMLLEAVGRAYAQGEVRPEVHPLATVLAVAATGLGVHVAARLLSEAFPAAAIPPRRAGSAPRCATCSSTGSRRARGSWGRDEIAPCRRGENLSTQHPRAPRWLPELATGSSA